MSTKVLLSASALVMGAMGVAGSFMPHEILRAMGAVPAGMLPLLVQLLAALLFAFAMVNWLARGSLIGGIYNRPVAVGNVAHFTIGALALVKASLAGEGNLVLTIVYAVFAIGFGMVLFRSPVAPA
jgi:ATP/ADP translocase